MSEHRINPESIPSKNTLARRLSALLGKAARKAPEAALITPEKFGYTEVLLALNVNIAGEDCDVRTSGSHIERQLSLELLVPSRNGDRVVVRSAQGDKEVYDVVETAGGSGDAEVVYQCWKATHDKRDGKGSWEVHDFATPAELYDQQMPDQKVSFAAAQVYFISGSKRLAPDDARRTALALEGITNPDNQVNTIGQELGALFEARQDAILNHILGENGNPR